MGRTGISNKYLIFFITNTILANIIFFQRKLLKKNCWRALTSCKNKKILKVKTKKYKKAQWDLKQMTIVIFFRCEENIKILHLDIYIRTNVAKL